MNYTRTCDFKSIPNILWFVNIILSNFSFFIKNLKTPPTL